MAKVFAPIMEKLLLIDSFMASIAVRMPTSAIMPIAIIIIVRTVRSNCPRMEESAIPMFTLKSPGILRGFIPHKGNFF
jgi:hypothetical protein